MNNSAMPTIQLLQNKAQESMIGPLVGTHRSYSMSGPPPALNGSSIKINEREKSKSVLVKEAFSPRNVI